MTDIDGPAKDSPEYLAALTLLQIRGCMVQWRPPAPNVLEVYEVRYRRDEDATTPRARVRLFYTDGYRGTQQALNLLRELTAATPTTALANPHQRVLSAPRGGGKSVVMQALT